MQEIDVLNSKFQNVKKIPVTIDLSPESINVPVVHQVVKAILASRRQGTSSTKTRAFVRGGGKKPYSQKGTGRARQGSTRSPLLVGGATLFGPQPRSYEQKVNKKQMLLAIQSIIADKFQARKLLVLESLKLTGKTKELATLLSEREITSALLVVNNENELAIRAAGNLEKVSALPVSAFSVYEAVKYETLIVEQSALQTLLAKLV